MSVEQGCMQCPRRCGAVRKDGNLGFCGVPWEFRIARVAEHFWEEPSISGKRGSGTIFFAGCNLRCVYCQNREVSRALLGRTVTADALAALMFRLRDEGAHNINLVTPTHYAIQLAAVLERVKPRLGIPVVYNCGGYESAETLRVLNGLVDIYLPDFKYFSEELAAAYSGAADYFSVAREALREMLLQTGKPQSDEAGILQRGTVVRHLVLPGQRRDSIALLQALAKEFGTDRFLLSLMSQYTPEFAADCPDRALHRRVTSFEYDTVCKEAERLGFDGYFQTRASANACYTPDFHEDTF